MEQDSDRLYAEDYVENFRAGKYTRGGLPLEIQWLGVTKLQEIQKHLIEGCYRTSSDRQLDEEDMARLENTLCTPKTFNDAVDYIRLFTRTLDLLAPDEPVLGGQEVLDGGQETDGGVVLQPGDAGGQEGQEFEGRRNRREKDTFALGLVTSSFILRMKKLRSLASALSLFRKRYNDPINALGSLLNDRMEILEYWKLSPFFRFGHPVTVRRRLRQLHIPDAEVREILSSYSE